jgi:hypothetical protein
MVTVKEKEEITNKLCVCGAGDAIETWKLHHVDGGLSYKPRRFSLGPFTQPTGSKNIEMLCI